MFIDPDKRRSFVEGFFIDQANRQATAFREAAQAAVSGNEEVAKRNEPSATSQKNAPANQL